MRYALNTTPINGWAIVTGGGLSAVAVSAQPGPGFAGNAALGQGTAATAIAGVGYGNIVAHPIGQPQIVVVSGTGAGMLARLGNGMAAVDIDAAGTGYARIHGHGSATVAINVQGEGTVIAPPRGRAVIEMLAEGDGAVASRGEGAAMIEMHLTGSAVIRRAVRAGGEMLVSVSGRGRGNLEMRGQGNTAVTMSATGAWKASAVHRGRGHALIELLPARGEPYVFRRVFGMGQVEIKITGRAGVPIRINPPATWRDAPAVRAMVASVETRRLQVRRDGRI